MRNVRLYDGTVRCPEHFDASSYEGETDEPCLYCPSGTDDPEDARWEAEYADERMAAWLTRNDRIEDQEW